MGLGHPDRVASAIGFALRCCSSERNEVGTSSGARVQSFHIIDAGFGLPTSAAFDQAGFAGHGELTRGGEYPASGLAFSFSRDLLLAGGGV